MWCQLGDVLYLYCCCTLFTFIFFLLLLLSLLTCSSPFVNCLIPTFPESFLLSPMPVLLSFYLTFPPLPPCVLFFESTFLCFVYVCSAPALFSLWMQLCHIPLHEFTTTGFRWSKVTNCHFCLHSSEFFFLFFHMSIYLVSLFKVFSQ